MAQRYIYWKLLRYTYVYEKIIHICEESSETQTRAKPVNFAIKLFQCRELIARRTALFTYFSSKNTY